MKGMMVGLIREGVVHLNTPHGNSERAASWLATFRYYQKWVVRWKINRHLQEREYDFDLYREMKVKTEQYLFIYNNSTPFSAGSGFYKRYFCSPPSTKLSN